MNLSWQTVCQAVGGIPQKNQCQEISTLPPEKLKGLAATYLSIPSEHLKYYSASQAPEAADVIAIDAQTKKKMLQPRVPQKSDQGRSKKNKATLKLDRTSLPFYSYSIQ
ncbi:unnamed protein product [Phytophthora fragariaefolia]|uniref:Unnamed protein product n=1 Tax=Phytophthora fragariaefolia TaxID=1490495 RepID=A0A9W6YMK6_9STRA|nr:unnamed protein product [Phytophthora fragariaefolia]